MAKRKKSRGFTDLSFTKQDLARNSREVVAKTGYHILLRVKPITAINSVWKLKMLAKGQGVKSIKKVIGFKTKTMLKKAKRKAKSVRKRAKTAMSYPRSRGGTRYTNGRTFKLKRKGIHYTKKGQPYKILASGQARFVKR
jgi:hypothetical protein